MEAISNSEIESMGYIPMMTLVCGRVIVIMNRRIRFRTYGGVRGREL